MHAALIQHRRILFWVYLSAAAMVFAATRAAGG